MRPIYENCFLYLFVCVVAVFPQRCSGTDDFDWLDFLKNNLESRKSIEHGQVVFTSSYLKYSLDPIYESIRKDLRCYFDGTNFRTDSTFVNTKLQTQRVYSAIFGDKQVVLDHGEELPLEIYLSSFLDTNEGEVYDPRTLGLMLGGSAAMRGVRLCDIIQEIQHAVHGVVVQSIVGVSVQSLACMEVTTARDDVLFTLVICPGWNGRVLQLRSRPSCQTKKVC